MRWALPASGREAVTTTRAEFYHHRRRCGPVVVPVVVMVQICMWMQTVTQSWLVLELTSSPFLLGLIATLQFGPILLFSIFAGILADCLTTRNILVFTQAVQGTLALTLGLLVWREHARYRTVAVMWGIMSALDQPTRQSFIIELVERQHLASAVGMNSASFNAARIVRPAVAGILIARVGLFAAFLLNALAFLVSIGALTRGPGRTPAPRAGAVPGLEEIAEGIAYVAGTPVVWFNGILGLVSGYAPVESASPPSTPGPGLTPGP